MPEDDRTDGAAPGEPGHRAEQPDDEHALPSPGAVLERIGDEATALPLDDLRALSSPPEDVTRSYLSTWKSLSPTRRRELLGRFQRLARRDPTLDFDRQHLAALFDPDPATRMLAIRGLHEHEREEFMSLLIDLLRTDAEASVRAEAADALGRFVVSMEFELLSEEASERLKDALRDTIEDVTESDDVRARALEALGAHSDEWVSELIAEMYESGSLPMRIATLRAMGRNAGDEWLPILIHHFDDDDSEVRAAAAAAAGQLLLEDAVGPLAMLVRDDDPDVRDAAVEALGEIQGEAAEAVLADLAKSNDPDLARLASSVLREARLLGLDFSEDVDAGGGPEDEDRDRDDDRDRDGDGGRGGEDQHDDEEQDR